VRDITDTSWVEVERTDSITYSVASTDTTYASQSKAHFVWTPEDTVVYRLDANNDVTYYQPAVEIPGTGLSYPEWWTILPISTKQPLIVSLDHDTSVSVSGYPGTVKRVLRSGYLGEGTITVNGKNYATLETFAERIVTVTVFDKPYTTNVYTEYGYSTELKTFVVRRQKVVSNHTQSPLPNGGEVLKLVKFTR
jgi:hypothetical protein